MEKLKYIKSLSDIHGRCSIHDLKMSTRKSNYSKSFKETNNIIIIPKKNNENVVPEEELFYSTEIAEEFDTTKYVRIIDKSDDTYSMSHFNNTKRKKKNIAQESEYLEKSYENQIKSNKKTEIQFNLEKKLAKKKFLVASLVFALISIIFLGVSSNLQIDEIESFDLEYEIVQVKNEFPAQDEDLWFSFMSGIDDTIKLSRPSIFMLLHSGLSNTSKEIAQKIALVASVALDANIKKPLEIDSKILNSELFLKDHGYVITKFKPELIERRAMIINNLDEVSGEVARGFHSFCDKETPLVAKSMIIFLMKSDHLEGDSLIIAENILRKKWSQHLNDDILLPLLVRITDAVYTVI